ncbi:MAG: outer membrane lipoprotein chaperone LolA [Vicinamibacterales bacterium]
MVSVLAALPIGAQPSTSESAPPGAPTADVLAGRLQTRYDAVKDFTADFSQSYRGGVLRKTTTEHGSLQVKKPGRMRWLYKSPEEKLFIADGARIYLYVPADRQVVVRPMPASSGATNPAMFLIGRGNIARDFRVRYTSVPGAPPGSWSLSLIPNQPQPEYESLVMVVAADTLTLRMLVATDAQGGTSTFTFTNVKENLGIPEKSFSFSIPRGVDVITEG